MLLAAFLALNPSVRFAIWAADAGGSTDPFAEVTRLGVAGVAVGLALLWQRDTAKQRDRFADMVETQAKATAPVLIEIRDVLRTVTSQSGASTKAMETMAEAVHRIPSEAEIVRLRDALAANDRQPPSTWRT